MVLSEVAEVFLNQLLEALVKLFANQRCATDPHLLHFTQGGELFADELFVPPTLHLLLRRDSGVKLEIR